ncbi:MAG: phosphoribosylaminoimidazolesuccinocarboxamide synthase [Candidatus Aenigmarchaeota archaeon]
MKEEMLREQLPFTLRGTDFPIKDAQFYGGKVRDNYTIGDRRVIVVTDKVSAFDVVIGTIPFKGQVLNQMAEFWFKQTRDIVKNHMIKTIDPNVMLVRQADTLPVEMVVRAYITGVTKTSAWYNYEQGVRDFCGNQLPEGLRKDHKLEKVILTPSTKAEKGDHDESVSAEEVVRRGLVSKELMDQLSEISFKLFEVGSQLVAKQGIILVDTKYEFGLDKEGNIMLIDEIHTPDSSRFWFADTYQQLFDAGQEQRKIDKEYIRKWLADQGYRGDGMPPILPPAVKIEAALRYIQAYEKITGQKFVPAVGNVSNRIETSLKESGFL